MSFNSFIFLMAFLPLVLITYWYLKKRSYNGPAVWFLILASLIFYGYATKWGIVVLIFSMSVNYLISSYFLKIQINSESGMVGRSKRRSGTVLFLGVAFNIALLALFKYAGNVGPLVYFSTPGISFYTFTGIALLCECYKGTIEGFSLKEYTFLYTFFPKMLQGPIVLPEGFIESVKEGGQKGLDYEQVYRGIVLFCLGMFKKVIIADTLGTAVDFGYTNLPSMHTGESLVIILSYTLQLYFDFSGYCDMAMAVSSFWGFELPLNFDSPYKAKDIGEFWDRWHITLTKFFTKYIYIPLGGNRRGSVRTYINIIIVFFVSGLWHGVGFGFVIWGLMHGVLSVVCRFLKKKGFKSNVISGVFTFLYVNIAWVFFRAPSVRDALLVFEGVKECWFPRFNTGLAKCFNLDELWYAMKILHLDRFEYSLYFLMVIILVLLMIIILFAPTAVNFARNCKINIFTTIFITILLVWSVLSFEGVATYLYVNF